LWEEVDALSMNKVSSVRGQKKIRPGKEAHNEKGTKSKKEDPNKYFLARGPKLLLERKKEKGGAKGNHLASRFARRRERLWEGMWEKGGERGGSFQTLSMVTRRKTDRKKCYLATL